MLPKIRKGKIDEDNKTFDCKPNTRTVRPSIPCTHHHRRHPCTNQGGMENLLDATAYGAAVAMSIAPPPATVMIANDSASSPATSVAPSPRQSPAPLPTAAAQANPAK